VRTVHAAQDSNFTKLDFVEKVKGGYTFVTVAAASICAVLLAGILSSNYIVRTVSRRFSVFPLILSVYH
jgi:hypothetical protein